MKQNAIIVDLDGTLANCDHRKQFIEGPKKDWKSFLKDENIIQDKLNAWCASIIINFKRSHKIILVTGRNEFIRPITEEWLAIHDQYYDLLLMRNNLDFRQDAVIKEEIFNLHIHPKFDVLFCIDDRKQVVKMWRKLGLVCLQCDEGEF